MAHTGYPYSVYNSGLRSKFTSNTSGLATVLVLANWLGGSAGSCSGPAQQCLTQSQFQTTPQQTTAGNLSRNSFRGPGYFDTDLSINKSIAVMERAHRVIGANMFNVLNHPNFDLPVSNVSIWFSLVRSRRRLAPASSAYGAFQGSAASGRLIVAHLKFEF